MATIGPSSSFQSWDPFPADPYDPLGSGSPVGAPYEQYTETDPMMPTPEDILECTLAHPGEVEAKGSVTPSVAVGPFAGTGTEAPDGSVDTQISAMTNIYGPVAAGAGVNLHKDPEGNRSVTGGQLNVGVGASNPVGGGIFAGGRMDLGPAGQGSAGVAANVTSPGIGLSVDGSIMMEGGTAAAPCGAMVEEGMAASDAVAADVQEATSGQSDAGQADAGQSGSESQSSDDK